MNINNFVKDNKLIVPEEEIDNIYAWVQISMTQKVLLSAKTYFEYMQRGFEKDANDKLEVLKSLNSRLSNVDYKFSDFITISANKNKIFSSNYCFAISTNKNVLYTLICYLCQMKNTYKVHFADLADLLMSHIAQPEVLTEALSSDVLCLELYAPLPEHKLRQTLLNTIISRRCKLGLYTMIFTINKNFIVGDNLMSLSRLKDNNYVDLTSMGKLLFDRRQQSYKQLLTTLLSITTYKENEFIYSKDEPKCRMLTISKY